MQEEMKNMTLDAFAEATASGDPVPGGGSVSALAGALAAALTGMVAGLTVGKKKYQDVWAEMEPIIPMAENIRTELMDAITEDSKSFDTYMQALSLPKDTPEEKEIRTAKMQEGLKEATKVPLRVAHKAAAILSLAKMVTEKGNATALSDGLVAAMMARTAVKGAAFNVRINLRSIKDELFVLATTAQVEALEKVAAEVEQEILEKAQEKL